MLRPADDGEDSEQPSCVIDSAVVCFCSRSVSFLKYWPVHQLAQHPKACVFHYFNRGQVLVRDSNISDWIYIVKSGSLSVLKKLQHVSAINSHGEGPDSSKVGNKATWRQRASRHAQQNRRNKKNGTNSPEVFRNQTEADRRLEQSLPGVFNAKDRLGVVDYDRIISDYRSRVVRKPASKHHQSLRLPAISGASGKEPLPEEQKERKEDEEDSADSEVEDEEDEGGEEEDLVTGNWEDGSTRPVSKTSKGVYLASSPFRRTTREWGQQRRRRRKARTQYGGTVAAKEAETVTESTLKEVSSPTEHGDPKSSNSQQEIDRLNIDYQRRFRERVGRKTMADQLDYKGARDFRYGTVDLNPMFVLVQVLERGQYFGVSQLMYPDQPSLCLVSNGAELIVLSKRLFLEKANETCIRHSRLSESPYPPDEALQSRLQDYVNWEAHRARVYRRLVTDIQDRHARRKQYLPSIPGKYCFRSGPL